MLSKNYLTHLLLVFISLITVEISWSQVPDWKWAQAMGGVAGYTSGMSVVGNSGNIFSTGAFSEITDFDPGAGIYFLTPSGADDIFISKLDSLGNFIWAKSIGGPVDTYSARFVIDPSENIYITGIFMGTVDFDPGAGTYNLTSVGADDIFTAKYDSSGNFIWAKAMGGTFVDFGRYIALDAAGNVYTTGQFRDTVDFDPGAGVYNLISPGNTNAFIFKLDGAGNFLWAKSLGGTDQDIAQSVTTDNNGNVYTTGIFRDTADFDPDSSGVFNLISTGGYDIFVSKLDSAGNFVWAKALGGAGLDESLSIMTDVSGNVYSTGYFYGTSDFDPGPGTYNLTSDTSIVSNIFISKLNSAGDFVWAKSIVSTDFCRGIYIISDLAGNIYFTGYYNGTADFNPDSSATYNLTSNGYQDIFVSELDSAGNFLWAKSAGDSNYEYGTSISFDAAGGILLSGSFSSSSLTFGDTTLSLMGIYDFFIAKLDTLTSTGLSPVPISSNAISVFPNPSNGKFTLTFPRPVFTGIVEIYNLPGEKIFEASLHGESRKEINLKNTGTGIYFLKVYDGENWYSEKLIVWNTDLTD